MKETQAFPSYIFSSVIHGTCVVALAIAFCFGTFNDAYGDGNSANVSASTKPRGDQRTTTRQYNERLPPVMPGEEIVTETGQKMKTWSSSGPVPVNRQPTPQVVGNGRATGGIGVIVDGRERYGRQGVLGQEPPLLRRESGNSGIGEDAGDSVANGF